MTLHSVIRNLGKSEKKKEREFYLSLNNSGTSVSENVRAAMNISQASSMTEDLPIQLLAMLGDFFPYLLTGEWVIGTMSRHKFRDLYPVFHGTPDMTEGENTVGVLEALERSRGNSVCISMEEMAQGIGFNHHRPQYLVDTTGATAFLTEEQKGRGGLLDSSRAVFFSSDDMVQGYGAKDDMGIVISKKNGGIGPISMRSQTVARAFGLAQSLFDIDEDMKDIALAHTEIISGILHHEGVSITRGRLVLPRLSIKESESYVYTGIDHSLGILGNGNINGTLYLGDLGRKKVPIAAAPGLASILFQELKKERLEKETREYLENISKVLRTSMS